MYSIIAMVHIDFQQLLPALSEETSQGKESNMGQN